MSLRYLPLYVPQGSPPSPQAILLGTTAISTIYIGAAAIAKVYVGATLIWTA